MPASGELLAKESIVYVPYCAGWWAAWGKWRGDPRAKPLFAPKTCPPYLYTPHCSPRMVGGVERKAWGKWRALHAKRKHLRFNQFYLKVLQRFKDFCLKAKAGIWP